jgi:hypothetical protein
VCSCCLALGGSRNENQRLNLSLAIVLSPWIWLGVSESIRAVGSLVAKLLVQGRIKVGKRKFADR